MARGDKAILEANKTKKLSISRFGAELKTYNTGGNMITTPDVADPDETKYPNQLGFDHMQSFYVGVEANPTTNFTAKLFTVKFFINNWL